MVKSMKYSILTYNFGGYDNPRKPQEVSEKVEYVFVTDAKTSPAPFIKKSLDIKGTPLAKCQYVKHHPFEFVSSDWVIVMDSSIEIQHDLTPLVEYCQEKGIEAMFISSPYATTWKTEIKPNPVWQKRNPNLKKEIDWLWKTFHDERLNIEGMFYILHKSELVNNIFSSICSHCDDLKKHGSDPRPCQVIYSGTVANEFADEIKTGKISFMSSYQIRGSGTLMRIYQHGSNRKFSDLKCRDKVNIIGIDYEPVTFKWLDRVEQSKPKVHKHTSGFEEWDE